MSAVIERYLDRLFDLLAGAGPAGRRTLAETEAHLTEHVQDLIAQGRAPDAAAREAIAHFGAPEVVAAAVAAPVMPERLVFHQVVASVWVFAATILITAGVSGALCWLVGCVLAPSIMAPDGPAMIHDAQACDVLMDAHPMAHDCLNAAVMQNFDRMVFDSLAGGLAGVTLLGLYFIARSSVRYASFTRLPPRSYLFVAGITAFGFAAAVWFVDGLDDYTRSVSWDWSYDFARGGASLLTALFFAVAAYRHARGVSQSRDIP
jgi:hypothetical protein